MASNNLRPLSRLEIIFIGVVSLLAFGYIAYLKLSPAITPIHLEARIQRADWWSSKGWVPTYLLSHITSGSSTADGQVSVDHIRYFYKKSLGSSVEYTEVDDKSFGLIRLKIQAEKTGDRYLYQGQELLIGNPLRMALENTQLELLISDISDQPFHEAHTPINITVKVYDKRPELITNFKKGLELSDNNGTAYATINNVSVTPSLITTTDQLGNTHLRQNPLNFDVIANIEVLTTKRAGQTLGYDGSIIEVGSRFIFNHPLLGRADGWIIDIPDSNKD